MDLDDSRPIWVQLANDFRHRIVSGQWPPGSKVPSVRELAASSGVNPNTVQRALGALDSEGLTAAERTAGRFITGDSGLIRETRERMADELIQRFLNQMEQLGYSGDEVQERLARRSAPESGEG